MFIYTALYNLFKKTTCVIFINSTSSISCIFIIITKHFCQFFQHCRQFMMNNIFQVNTIFKTKETGEIFPFQDKFSSTTDSTGDAEVEGLDVPRAPPSGGQKNCSHFKGAVADSLTRYQTVFFLFNRRFLQLTKINVIMYIKIPQIKQH